MNATAPKFTWSFSHLKNFETCPKRYYHIQVAKDVVEPEGPAIVEGNAIHKAIELRLGDAGTPLPLAYMVYEPLMQMYDRLPGRGATEVKWGVTEDFRPTTFFGRNVWMRAMGDAVKLAPPLAYVFDWKTGRPSDDTTQLSLMAATIMIHHQNVDRVKARMVFLNDAVDDLHRSPGSAPQGIVGEEYTRAMLPEIWNDVLPRVRAVQEAKRTSTFPPKPSGLCKRYCPVTACPFHGKGG